MAKFAPAAPPSPGEGKLREELRAGYADVRVGGHKLGFGLLDVGAAFEELRRDAGGQIGGWRSECGGVGVRDGAGCLAEQQAELVFGLLDLLLELRDLGGGGVEELLGLANVRERSGAAGFELLGESRESPGGL